MLTPPLRWVTDGAGALSQKPLLVPGAAERQRGPEPARQRLASQELKILFAVDDEYS